MLKSSPCILSGTVIRNSVSSLPPGATTLALVEDTHAISSRRDNMANKVVETFKQADNAGKIGDGKFIFSSSKKW